MSRGFSPEEKEFLKSALLKEYTKRLQYQPVNKISIDDLVASVGISKGSFYLFFDSKEQIFVDVLKQIQGELLESGLDLIENEEVKTKDTLKTVLLFYFNYLKNYPWLQNLYKVEYAKILRKASSDIKFEFLTQDDHDFKLLFDKLNLKFSVPHDQLIGAIQIIYFSITELDRFGDTYDDAISLLIDSLINQCVILD